MKAYWFSVLLAAFIFASAPPAASQETMRVAIPLFPSAAFPVLVANDRGFFQRGGPDGGADSHQQRADNVSSADFGRRTGGGRRADGFAAEPFTRRGRDRARLLGQLGS